MPVKKDGVAQIPAVNCLGRNHRAPVNYGAAVHFNVHIAHGKTPAARISVLATAARCVGCQRPELIKINIGKGGGARSIGRAENSKTDATVGVG